MTKSFFSRFTEIPSAITAAAAASSKSSVSRGGVPGSAFHGFLVKGITRSRGGGGASSSIAASPKAAIPISVLALAARRRGTC